MWALLSLCESTYFPFVVILTLLCLPKSKKENCDNILYEKRIQINVLNQKVCFIFYFN